MELKRPILKKAGCFTIFFLLIILCFFSWREYYKKSIDANHILMDAKNIQLAMRMISIQYYGVNRNVYAPDTIYGMEEDTLEEVRTLSGTNGEITLVSWCALDNVPRKFYYRTNSCLLIYEYDTEEKELSWDIYRLHPIVKFGK